MTRRRWIAEHWDEATALLIGTQAEHLIRVLRLQPGAEADVVAARRGPHPGGVAPVALTRSVCRGRPSVGALDARGTSLPGMDFVAVALALVAFIAFYGLIALVDRI